MGAEVVVEGLTKSFGSANIWRDVSLTLPPGEVSALLGPSGTGKSVFLKSMIGLLRPERGKCLINGIDICSCSESELYEVRKLFGVLFQDGALFGSMTLYDNVAFPLREHTKKSESDVKRIVLEKLEMTGLKGAEKKLPGEISGGMRKRAGLARAWCWTRRSSWWTSRTPAWTRFAPPTSASCSWTSTPRSTRPSSSSRTTSTWPARCRTTSACSSARNWSCSVRAKCC